MNDENDINKMMKNYENDFQKCIREALHYNTPGVEVRLEYPRHEYIENRNFRTNTNESKI